MADAAVSTFLIFNDEEGQFGDNAPDPYTVVIDLIDPANVSAWSASIFLTSLPPPGVPVCSGRSHCCGSENIITWLAVIGAVSYRVYEGSVLLIDTALLTYTRNLSRIQQLTSHTYTVVAVGECGDEGASCSTTVLPYYRRRADPTCANTRVAGPATVYVRDGCE